MFNWEKFKKGEIAVHCDTKEKAINFLKECDTQGVKWKCGGDLKSLTKWDFYKRKTVYGCCDGDANLYYGTDIYYVEHDIPIIKWNIKEDNIEKTFREVIADIKEGEVWESAQDCFQLKEISCIEGRIKFKLEGVFVEKTDNLNNVDTGEGSGQTFKLQRKQYTFEEAFKAYEDGKEIESCYSGDKYMIQHGGSDCYADGSKTGTIGFNEIRGKWYINN